MSRLAETINLLVRGSHPWGMTADGRTVGSAHEDFLHSMLAVVAGLLILSLSFQECKPPSAPEDRALVLNMRFSPGVFDSFRRNTEIRYTLRSPSVVSLVIVRRDAGSQDRRMKTLFNGGEESAGSQLRKIIDASLL